MNLGKKFHSSMNDDMKYINHKKVKQLVFFLKGAPGFSENIIEHIQPSSCCILKYIPTLRNDV